MRRCQLIQTAPSTVVVRLEAEDRSAAWQRVASRLRTYLASQGLRDAHVELAADPIRAVASFARSEAKSHGTWVWASPRDDLPHQRSPCPAKCLILPAWPPPTRPCSSAPASAAPATPGPPAPRWRSRHASWRAGFTATACCTDQLSSLDTAG